jgi:hypothetical protein
MQTHIGRSYKRWQAGENYEKAKEVMKHFFPTNSTSTGLNRRARIETMPINDAIGRALATKKAENEQRSVVLAFKCNLPKEQ